MSCFLTLYLAMKYIPIILGIVITAITIICRQVKRIVCSVFRNVACHLIFWKYLLDHTGSYFMLLCKVFT